MSSINNSKLPFSDNLNFDVPFTTNEADTSNVGKVSGVILSSNKIPDPTKTFKAKDISEDVKETIENIEVEKQKLMSKKVSSKKVSIAITAAVVSIVSGLILGGIGIVALATGVGIPVGLGLLGTGVGLFALGCGIIKVYSKSINTLDQIEKKQNKIESLKYLQSGVEGHDEEKFKNYLHDLREKMALTNLSLPDFFIQYPETLDLYKLSLLKDEESKTVRYDSANYRYYPCTTNYAREMVRFINNRLKDHMVDKSNSGNLKALYKLKDLRSDIVKELPIVDELMSPDSFEQIELIKNEAK